MIFSHVLYQLSYLADLNAVRYHTAHGTVSPRSVRVIALCH